MGAHLIEKALGKYFIGVWGSNLYHKEASKVKWAKLKSKTPDFYTKKTFILGVQGHLRSSMLILLKSSPLVLVIISKMSVPICNSFHARRGNISKITPFEGYPYIYAQVRRSPQT